MQMATSNDEWEAADAAHTVAKTARDVAQAELMEKQM